jgi:transcriptional regulator with XRE-family HTH domain
MSIDVGGHLKAVRMMYGLSQRELAKRAGVTNGTISLIEQNRVSPSVSSLKKVLDGVPMSLADFFTLDLQETPQALDFAALSAEQRAIGYHNQDNGRWRMQLLQEMLTQLARPN